MEQEETTRNSIYICFLYMNRNKALVLLDTQVEVVPLVVCMAGRHVSYSQQDPGGRGRMWYPHSCLGFLCHVALQFTCAQFSGFIDHIIWF